MKLLCLLLFPLACTLFISNQLFAQTDTTIIYYNDYTQTSKDSANNYSLIVKTGDRWISKNYSLPAGKLLWEGYFSDEKFTRRIGIAKSYYEDGGLKALSVYNDTSKLVSKTYFYKEGGKLSKMTLDTSGKYIDSCWDKAGNIKPGCVIEKEAKFPGGPQGWKRYLERNLKADVAAEIGAPEGMYPVTVQFRVDKQGRITNIVATKVPAYCKPCSDEVIRVLKSGPDWEPATVNDEPVIYQAIQQITFSVVEDKPKRKERRM